VLYQEFKDITENVSGAAMGPETEILIEELDHDGNPRLVPVRQAEIRYTYNRSGDGTMTSRIVFRT
jgi:hypothetical protein